ncbi:MAG TPA: CoA ester lyase, partial [Hyphomicrobiaceae bacterium]|nr:CoA ester lyase [Hyphomicrobiaceae bacterium]
MYRSLLYVPANNEKFVAKAASRGADAIILDLEDSIAPSEKLAARAALLKAVPVCASGGSDVWVRVNRPMRQCTGDLEAVVASGAHGILLPKAESADHVRFVAEILEDIERELGVSHETRMIVLLEDPAAVLGALQIISAHPRVIGASAGGEDLSTAMDAEAGPEALRFPKLMVHLAAKGVGRYSLGLMGTVADYSDHDAIRTMVAEGRRHGFDGASCIHPSVVPLLNEGFAPDPESVTRARRIVEAFEAAESAGQGAISLDGRMIDLPVAERARRLLARAGKSGLG